MVSEDSIWCCIWSSYCTPPPPPPPLVLPPLDETQYLLYFVIIIPLFVFLGCLGMYFFQDLVKQKATKTIETTKTMAASISSCSHTIAAADSFGKLKRVLKKVADQTNKVYGESGEGLNGKTKASLRTVHNAIVAFVNEADHEHHMHLGEPMGTRIPGERVVCNKLSPPSPPPSPPSSPPLLPLSDSSVNIAHSTLT